MLAEQILSINKLAFTVGVSREVLEALAKDRSKHYSPFIVSEKKRNRLIKKRKIDNPDKAIRKVQLKINKIILTEACKELPPYMTGSIPERSTYDNARPHSRKEAVLQIDIADCFPSIHSSNVYAAFKKRLGCSPPVASLLTKLTTYGDRLPQGAPTSPSLCNIVLTPLAETLNKIAIDNNIAFTQYIDDLTFSGSYTSLHDIENKLIKAVESAGFKVSRKKLRLVKNKDRMEITGLVVNQRVGVGRRYLRRVQREIMQRKTSEHKVKGKISYIRSISKSQAKKLTRRFVKTTI